MKRLAAAALLLLSVAGAARADVNLYTTREPGLVKPLVEGFTAATGIKVNSVFVNAGLAERVQAEGAGSVADVLMTVDIASLADLSRKGLTQPHGLAEAEAVVPAALRDPDGHWLVLSLRARAILVAKDRVTDAALTYEDLASPRFRGRVCLRGGNHPYNTALFAAMIAKSGAAATEAYLTALKSNLARKPAGGDREVARDIMAGLCDIGLTNTYYMGLMLSGAGGAEQKRWGEAVRVILPTFADKAGSHVNVSGAAIAKHAPNRAEAARLLAWLLSPAAQKVYAEGNYEYPVRAEVAPHPIIAGLGTLRVDTTPIGQVVAHRGEASLMVDRTRVRPLIAARLAVGAAALLVLAPVAGLAVFAARGSGGLWPHLAAYVLPDALRETALLLAGVGALSGVMGFTTAWLVTSRAFPGRGVLEWALLLPLAMPSYIVAYAYADLLHPVGPVQGAMRGLFGLRAGALLPDVRSLGGAVLLLGSVLYPYVYMHARAALLMRAAASIEAARSLGADGRRVLLRVALPLAWPSVAAGMGLAMMEALGDIGASEFLGVRTLTVAIYDTWVTRGSIEGAAQIALAALGGVALLVGLERHVSLRGDRAEEGAGRRLGRVDCAGWRGWLAMAVCAAPVVVGFGLPATHLVVAAGLRTAEFGLPAELAGWMWNSVRLAAPATVVTLLAGFGLAFVGRVAGGAWVRLGLRVASLGYALPGTVLAVGLLVPAGLVGLSGTLALVMLAYAVRFLAVPVGAFETGYGRIAREVDDMARGLGAGLGALALRVHGPMLWPSWGAAGVLVFIECVKELPATLLLRPLNVETLATHLYGEAARGTYEDGAVAALAIVVAALAPVAMTMARARRAAPEGARRLAVA